MVEVLRVTDDTSREFLADLIHEANRQAKRMPHIVGCDKLHTPWDEIHLDIDALLEDYLEAPA